MPLPGISDAGFIAIDGQTRQRSDDRVSGQSAIHMVSEWAIPNQVSLGEVVVAEKSDEITVVPR